jgi:hypothetical protein
MTDPFDSSSAPTQPATSRKRIFISYKRTVDPDENVAREVYESLIRHHDVFIDQRDILVGMYWAELIEQELARSDFLITFLSKSSVNSEMVRGEIETAHRLGKEQPGKPTILPVRLNYLEPFKNPLSAWLNPISWALWSGASDTPRLIEELKYAIQGGKLSIDQNQAKKNILEIKHDLITTNELPSPPQPLPTAELKPLESPQGTMSSESFFYITRPSDPIALDTIKQPGVTLTIKGPRQMGKSSLLIRAIEAAKSIGKCTAFLDFQLMEKSDLANADSFLRQFCFWLTDELGMKNRVDEYWDSPLNRYKRCTSYVEDYLLADIDGSLVLAIDEADSILDTDFRSDFFGMLRAWHNNRARSQTWKRLDLALVISTEPYQLIENLYQSPFNVGEVIELADFTPEQITDLNRRHGTPLNPEQERQLIRLLGGHPYLVRRALYLIAKQLISTSDLFTLANGDRGPFGDHLRYHVFRLRGKEDLIEGLREVLRHHTCEDKLIFFRLRGAGLVHEERNEILPRCKLYTDYFAEHLNVKPKA